MSETAAQIVLYILHSIYDHLYVAAAAVEEEVVLDDVLIKSHTRKKKEENIIINVFCSYNIS
jgi:hypothetical protein